MASAELVPGLDFFVPGSDDADPIVAAAVVKGAAQVEDLQGDIDGVRYIAASTAGGGTCGLHAIWGRCIHEGAPLYANKAREYLLASVPSDVGEICQLQNGFFQEGFLEMLDVTCGSGVLLEIFLSMRTSLIWFVRSVCCLVF